MILCYWNQPVYKMTMELNLKIFQDFMTLFTISKDFWRYLKTFEDFWTQNLCGGKLGEKINKKSEGKKKKEEENRME